MDHSPIISNQQRAGMAQLNCLEGGTRIAIVVAGIVLAMRDLHSRRIIHRDLKPTNILIDWDWIVRIADFTPAVLVATYGDALSPATDSLPSPPSVDLRPPAMNQSTIARLSQAMFSHLGRSSLNCSPDIRDSLPKYLDPF
jgi:serine/threonine protein kinase